MNATGTAERPTKLVFPEAPRFESVDEERRDRKERLAAALRVFSELGFDRGVAGHITARDPEDPARFWVNPYGVHFGDVKTSDLICVDHQGQVVSGSGVLNTAAFAIHSAVHTARPDVVGVAHAHSRFGAAWSATGQLIQPLTTESCFFFEDHVVYDAWSGVVTEQGHAEEVAASLGVNRAAILRNHGLLTVGESVDEAAWWFIALERACEAEFLTRSIGDTKPLPPAAARETHNLVATPHVGWFSFQPLYQKVVTEQPDLLD